MKIVLLIFVLDASVVPPFKPSRDARTDWLKWKRVLERYLKLNKITEEEDKCDLLLVLGGIDLQDQYDKIVHYEVTTTDIGETGVEIQRVDKYASIILSLDRYYAPKTNKRYERHLLRNIKQDENESFDDFVNRLREQANRCEFADVNDATVDQIIEGCISHDFRKKLLSEEKSFEEVLQLGKAMEDIQVQSKAYLNLKNVQLEPVQRLQPVNKSGVRCFKCNRVGHIARDKHICPAIGVKCHSCGEMDHFKYVVRRNASEMKITPIPLRKGRKYRSRKDYIA